MPEHIKPAVKAQILALVNVLEKSGTLDAQSERTLGVLLDSRPSDSLVKIYNRLYMDRSAPPTGFARGMSDMLGTLGGLCTGRYAPILAAAKLRLAFVAMGWDTPGSARCATGETLPRDIAEFALTIAQKLKQLLPDAIRHPCDLLPDHHNDGNIDYTWAVAALEDLAEDLELAMWPELAKTLRRHIERVQHSAGSLNGSACCGSGNDPFDYEKHFSDCVNDLVDYIVRLVNRLSSCTEENTAASKGTQTNGLDAIRPGEPKTPTGDTQAGMKPDTQLVRAQAKDWDGIPVATLRKEVPQKVCKGDSTKLANWLKSRNVPTKKLANRILAEPEAAKRAFAKHKRIRECIDRLAAHDDSDE